MSSLSTRSRTPRVLGAIALIGALVSGCSDSRQLTTAPLTSKQVAAPPGQDIAAAVRAQEKVTPGLLAIRDVVATGVGLDGDGVPVVRVFTATQGVPGIPADVDGIPVDVRVTGLIVADSDPTQKARPAPLGFSVGHYAITAGTIGARVKDASGNTYILSNNHVLANANNAAIGDAILQPGPYDGGTASDQIGTLSAFQSIAFNLGAPNYIDAAIAAVSPSDVGVSTPSDGYGTPNATPFNLDQDGDGTVDAGLLGLSIQKFGRTTNLTTGTVTEVNVTVDVCYEVLFGIFCLRSARFEDQLGFSDISDGGDSGSLIVTNDPSRQPVALLFAGSDTRTLGNRIDRVLSHFGVSIDDGGGSPPPPPPPPPVDEAPTASFTYDCTDLTCGFDATGSTDDGTIATYAWDFGDGTNGSGVTPNHTYASGATRTVVLTVTDDGGQQDTDSQSVTTTDPSTPPVDDPPMASFTFGCIDLTCDFDATGSTDDGTIVSYAWDFGDGSNGSGMMTQHAYTSGATRTVVLTVTDNGGQQDTDSQSVMTTEPPAASPTLTATKKRAKGGVHQVDLAWTGVTWSTVYVWRQVDDQWPPVVIDSLPGSSTGTYSDVTGNKGKGYTYTHFICESGTDLLAQCSNWVITSY